MDAITYTSEEDYKFSSSYKSLVQNHYNSRAAEMAKDDDSIDQDIAMLKVGGTIESQIIKNDLLFKAARFGITYTDKIEEFYAAYKAAGSTNEKNNTNIEKSYNTLKKLAKGSTSPKFVNYENNAGGTTSLDDLKGKYVYVDVWATWCGPCKAEIPFLKKVEKQYHNKNIEFISISIDVAKDHQKWKDMVKDKELGGIQLFADKDWKSQFIEDYLKSEITNYVKDVVVDVRIMNFKITVIGEVKNPGVFPINDERVTLTEALALAGDLTVDANRHTITIIREENDVQKVTKIDLTTTDLYSSPFYFLKQNDLVYVEPSKKGVVKTGFVSDISILLSIVTVLLSSVILITNIN